MLKKLDSILLYVRDVAKTADFYRQLGFNITQQTQDKVVATLGSFELHCHDQKKVHFKQDSHREPKGVGVFIYILVDDIDAYHKSLIKKGLTPSSAPTDWPWRNREFAVKDPNGYRLVFYQPLTK